MSDLARQGDHPEVVQLIELHVQRRERAVSAINDGMREHSTASRRTVCKAIRHAMEQSWISRKDGAALAGRWGKMSQRDQCCAMLYVEAHVKMLDSKQLPEVRAEVEAEAGFLFWSTALVGALDAYDAGELHQLMHQYAELDLVVMMPEEVGSFATTQRDAVRTANEHERGPVGVELRRPRSEHRPGEVAYLPSPKATAAPTSGDGGAPEQNSTSPPSPAGALAAHASPPPPAIVGERVRKKGSDSRTPISLCIRMPGSASRGERLGFVSSSWQRDDGALGNHAGPQVQHIFAFSKSLPDSGADGNVRKEILGLTMREGSLGDYERCVRARYAVDPHASFAVAALAGALPSPPRSLTHWLITHLHLTPSCTMFTFAAFAVPACWLHACGPRVVSRMWRRCVLLPRAPATCVDQWPRV